MARFTLSEISGALSRVLSVSPDSAVIGRFAGQLEHSINSRPDFQKSGLGGSGFQTLVLSHLPTEVADLMNPAKLQELQRRRAENANPTGAQPATLETVAATFLDRRSLASEDDRRGSRERAASSATEGLSAIKADNFAGTPFAAAGLSYSTFAALRALGFGESNIMHAAQDARVNGFNPDNRKIAGAFATLDKDDGHRRDERNKLLGKFRERLDSDEEFQRLKAEREKAKTGVERIHIEKHMHERGREISRETGYHGHFSAAPTGRARDAGKLIEHETIEQRARENIKALTHGNRADAEAATQVIERYRRNPNDAAARSNYEKLKEAHRDNPGGRKALSALEKTLEKDEKFKAAEVGTNSDRQRLNRDKAIQVTTAVSSNDDLLASMTGTEPVKKAEANPTKNADENTVSKSQDTSKRKPATRLAGSLAPGGV